MSQTQISTPLLCLPIVNLQTFSHNPDNKHTASPQLNTHRHQQQRIQALMGNQKNSKGLSRFFHSASDSNLVTNPPGGLAASDGDSQSVQSLVEQNPHQAALCPPTISRRRRVLNRLGWKSPLSSPLPSPSDHHIATSVSSSGDHGSPSRPDIQGSPFAPASAPASTQTSRELSEPTASENPVPCTPRILITPHVQDPAKTDAHEADHPDTTESPPHSSAVWTKALDIAQKILTEKQLPQLDLINLPPAVENIEAVVRSLNALQEDEQKNRWTYTWRGKKIIIADRLGEILRSMEKYSNVVGTAIQCDPQVGAIVWAGVQGIMRVRISCTLLYRLLILIY